MKKLALILTLLTATLLTNAQTKVYFPFFELINVHEEYQYSTSKLLKTYMDNEGRYQLILPPRPTGTFTPETFAQTQQNAQELDAQYFLTGEINALEDIMIISVSMYRSEDGKLIWGDVLKAASMDDMDPMLELLARAIGTKNKASKLEDIYSVSEYETNELTKKDASSTFGIYLGGMHTSFDNTAETFSSGFGAKISYDLRDLILDINGEIYFGTVDIIDLNLSALYPFRMARKSPFIGGGLGYGSHKIKLEDSFTNASEKNSGLQGYAHAGYIFSRTSNVQLRLTVSAYSAFYKIADEVPAGFGFNLGISF